MVSDALEFSHASWQCRRIERNSQQPHTRLSKQAKICRCPSPLPTKGGVAELVARASALAVVGEMHGVPVDSLVVDEKMCFEGGLRQRQQLRSGGFDYTLGYIKVVEIEITQERWDALIGAGKVSEGTPLPLPLRLINKDVDRSKINQIQTPQM